MCTSVYVYAATLKLRHQDAPECAPSVRPAHQDPRMNEHVLVQLWGRLSLLRGQRKGGGQLAQRRQREH